MHPTNKTTGFFFTENTNINAHVPLIISGVSLKGGTNIGNVTIYDETSAVAGTEVYYGSVAANGAQNDGDDFCVRCTNGAHVVATANCNVNILVRYR